jgi:hypothetical protein
MTRDTDYGADDDPFRHDDAAYVLGALSADERDAFEAHLATCADCTARVAEIRGLPDLLAGIDEADVLAADPVPDTLLPALLRSAAGRRRRTRVTIGALASLAAACVIALVVVLWPSSSAPAPTRQQFVAVGQVPLTASAVLTPKAWGTAIDIRCHYLPGVESTFRYGLVVYSRAGGRYPAGSWTLPPDKDIDYRTGTALRAAQIARIEITLPGGRPVLRLTP